MARIAGVNLEDKWKVDYALTKIRGVGWALSKKVLNSVKISDERRVKELKPTEVSQIATKLEEYTIEGELARQLRQDIQRLKNTGSYRGIRHQRGLPSRGQRTKSNARTKRGKRKTVGAYKKAELAKQQPTS